MATKTEKFMTMQIRKDLPQIRPGDTVKIHQIIKEGDKERIQVFEGLVIARKHGKGISSTITVRKVVQGVGVERVFPIHSPSISKIEVVKSGKVRRAKLYYLRHAKGKKARLKNKEYSSAISDEEETEETQEESQEEVKENEEKTTNPEVETKNESTTQEIKEEVKSETKEPKTETTK